MRAALCQSLDGPDAIIISDIEMPEIGSGELLVNVKAISLNFADTLQIRGKYQQFATPPFSPGMELVGEIAAIGDNVEGFEIGDRILSYLRDGGAAREYVIINPVHAYKIPKSLSDEKAAGLLITYGTSLRSLDTIGELKPGETVAILGAAGGTGLAAIELAKLLGARVIACASDHDKLTICKTHGADDVLNYAEENLKEGLKTRTEGKGVDVVYDPVGGDLTEQALRGMRTRGRLIVVGFASGKIPSPPLNLILLKECDLRGIFWGRAVYEDAEAVRKDIDRIIAWAAEGKIDPHIHVIHDLDEIQAALRILDERKAKGKVIVRI